MRLVSKQKLIATIPYIRILGSFLIFCKGSFHLFYDVKSLQFCNKFICLFLLTTVVSICIHRAVCWCVSQLPANDFGIVQLPIIATHVDVVVISPALDYARARVVRQTNVIQINVT